MVDTGTKVYRAGELLTRLNIEIPNVRTESMSEDGRTARFVIGPLAPGFGTTLGNALRRVLISSISGSAITYIRFEKGPLHEYATIDGVKEDGIELLLNFKGLQVALQGDARTATLKLDVSGVGEVVTGDVQPHPDCVILNPTQHLATLTSDKAALKVEIGVAKGIGFLSSDDHVPNELNPSWDGDEFPLGVIVLDSKFSPIEKTNYTVRHTRVAQNTEFDELEIELRTNGASPADEALSEAANILQAYFSLFSKSPLELADLHAAAAGPSPEEELLSRPIEDLELPVRPYNCLKQIGVKTIGELIECSEAELLKLRNFGEKSLLEIKEKLEPLGLSIRGGRRTSSFD
ncbi:MAG: DNA-directed RNA polymerase subunit alpha [bacterium]